MRLVNLVCLSVRSLLFVVLATLACPFILATNFCHWFKSQKKEIKQLSISSDYMKNPCKYLDATLGVIEKFAVLAVILVSSVYGVLVLLKPLIPDVYYPCIQWAARLFDQMQEDWIPTLIIVCLFLYSTLVDKIKHLIKGPGGMEFNHIDNGIRIQENTEIFPIQENRGPISASEN